MCTFGRKLHRPLECKGCNCAPKLIKRKIVEESRDVMAPKVTSFSHQMKEQFVSEPPFTDLLQGMCSCQIPVNFCLCFLIPDRSTLNISVESSARPVSSMSLWPLLQELMWVPTQLVKSGWIWCSSSTSRNRKSRVTGYKTAHHPILTPNASTKQCGTFLLYMWQLHGMQSLYLPCWHQYKRRRHHSG